MNKFIREDLENYLTEQGMCAEDIELVLGFFERAIERDGTMEDMNDEIRE